MLIKFSASYATRSACICIYSTDRASANILSYNFKIWKETQKKTHIFTGVCRQNELNCCCPFFLRYLFQILLQSRFQYKAFLISMFENRQKKIEEKRIQQKAYDHQQVLFITRIVWCVYACVCTPRTRLHLYFWAVHFLWNDGKSS